MQKTTHDWIIIGGGAAGLMLAAKKKVNNGIILEGTDKLGSKLLMTGGGRCNLSHAGSIKSFIDCYGEAGKVLRKVLYKHNNNEMIKWLNSQGLETVCEDDKYYPASMKASDFRDFLIAKAKENGWSFLFNAKVTNIQNIKNAKLKSTENNPNYRWIITADCDYYANNVVIATGGKTYPKTGSNGSIFSILQSLSVNITALNSALAPIDIVDYPYSELAGISISDVTINNKETGGLLFTHKGFSGPAILNYSKYCKVGDFIHISYNRTLDELPKRLHKALEDRACGESGDVKTKILESLLKNDSFKIKRIDENGMVTCGGIDLHEIDMTSMQIEKLPGIYAIGEVLDVDGKSGGYNLQMCYSTASMVATL